MYEKIIEKVDEIVDSAIKNAEKIKNEDLKMAKLIDIQLAATNILFEAILHEEAK